MSPEVLSALADLVGAFPRVVMAGVGLGAFAVLVAMAATEVVLRYGESGPGEYSVLDRRDGLGDRFPSHVVSGEEVAPPAAANAGVRASAVGVEEPGVAVEVVATPLPARPASSSPSALLSAGLPPGHVSREGVRWP